MCSVLVSYNKKNRAANNLMYALAKTRGVKIDDDSLLTDEEILAVKEARMLGTCKDIDGLKEYLRSQL